MNGKINLDNVDVYRPQLVEITEMKNSVFRVTFENAFKNVLSIIKDNERNSKLNKEAKTNFYNDAQSFNNIVAFTGDRGAGKTSAMISCVNALSKISDVHDNDISFSEALIKIKKEDYCFNCLKIIEPSNFINGERLLEIVVSNMFSNISSIIENRRTQIDNNDKRNIYTSFDEVFSALRTIYLEKKDLISERCGVGSALETLEQLSMGQRLKQKFNKLACDYLEFVKKYEYRNDKKSILVISIDDLDMNMDNGYEMAEEIRKYLITENVIVVMSLNISQFMQIIQQEYIKSMKELYNNKLLNDDPADMASKYLTKLIPTNRRNPLPSFNSSNIANCKLENGEEANLVDYFLEKIYKTTGMILLKNENMSHEIIPTNLREILYLNKLLEDMSETETEDNIKENILYRSRKNEADRTRLESNLDKFEDYLINFYIRTNMPKEYSDILMELLNQESEDMNKFLAGRLVGNDKILNINRDKNTDKDSEKVNLILNEIAAPDALPQNISIGDVLFLLNQLSNQKSDIKTKRFIEGVKMIYSIRLIRHMFLESKEDTENKKDTDEKNTVEIVNVKKERRILGEFLYNIEDPGTVDLIRKNREMVTAKNIKYVENIKELLGNFTFNCLVSRYTTLNTTNEDIISRTAYKSNYYASYEYPYHHGATNNVVINFTSFILNLLDLNVLKNRLNNEFVLDVPESYKTWESEYVAVIPVWSIDFIDAFIRRLRRTAELKAVSLGEYFIYISRFCKSMEIVIDNIIRENLYLKNSKIKKAFTENPVLSKELINNEETKQIIEQIGKWYNLYNEKPKYIRILGEKYEVKSWEDVHVKVIEKIIEKNPEKYDLIVNSPDLEDLNISTTKKGQNKKVNVGNGKDFYVDTKLEPEKIYALCKTVMKITGNSENAFEIDNIK